MFRLVGIIVVLMFCFKFGRRVGGPGTRRVRGEVRSEIPKNSRTRTNDSQRRYFCETIVDDCGNKSRRMRAIEEVDEDEYWYFKDRY